VEGNPALFRDLTYIFVAAVLGGLAAWRLRLPLILGFVAGGIFISPFTPGPHLSDPQTFRVFAEVGVVLLMFSVGAEFSIPELLRAKWVALVGGPVGILCVMGLTIAVAKLSGWTTAKGIVIGSTVSVASTMVMARLLNDRGELNSTHGRVMIGITLVEDMAVVCMTVVLPVFGTAGKTTIAEAAWTLGKAMVLLIPLIFLAIWGIPRFLRRTKRTNSTELFLLVVIAMCLGTAALAQAAGFSIALGAFLAGLSISGSEDPHHAATQLAPLRDAFVALFFVSLGTLIDPRVLSGNLALLGIMLSLIVVGKFAIWVAIVRLFRYSTRTAISVGVGLTQIGELSFVLVEVARSSGLVDDGVFAATLAASLFSILLNVFMVRVTLRRISQTHPSNQGG